MALAERAITEPPPARGVAAAERRQLFVHLSEARLADETPSGSWQAELHDHTAIAGDTLLRLACDSGVVVAKTDRRGNVLDIGRRQRTVPPALQRALRMRDRRCRFPGCNHSAFVDAHHIEHWAQGGATALSNLVLVCHAHHVALQEGGFSVRLESGTPAFSDPSRAVIPAAPLAPLVDRTAAPLRIRHVARGITISARTSLIRRGWLMRPNLKDCVRALVRRYDRKIEAEAADAAPLVH